MTQRFLQTSTHDSELGDHTPLTTTTTTIIPHHLMTIYQNQIEILLLIFELSLQIQCHRIPHTQHTMQCNGIRFILICSLPLESIRYPDAGVCYLFL